MVNGSLPRGVVPQPAGAGQRSVWDFPRPPVVEPDDRLVTIEFNGEQIAATTRALKVLETSHPPTWYLPISDFVDGALQPCEGGSVCEYKGRADYYDVVAGERRAPAAAWGYRQPWPGFESLADHVAVYAAAMDRVTVADEPVRAQPGGFYGGWVTDDVVGPFKGVPGSFGW